jgi:hypothetical protein
MADQRCCFCRVILDFQPPDPSQAALCLPCQKRFQVSLPVAPSPVGESEPMPIVPPLSPQPLPVESGAPIPDWDAIDPEAIPQVLPVQPMDIPPMRRTEWAHRHDDCRWHPEPADLRLMKEMNRLGCREVPEDLAAEEKVVGRPICGIQVGYTSWYLISGVLWLVLTCFLLCFPVMQLETIIERAPCS